MVGSMQLHRGHVVTCDTASLMDVELDVQWLPSAHSIHAVHVHSTLAMGQVGQKHRLARARDDAPSLASAELILL